MHHGWLATDNCVKRAGHTHSKRLIKRGQDLIRVRQFLHCQKRSGQCACFTRFRPEGVRFAGYVIDNDVWQRVRARFLAIDPADTLFHFKPPRFFDVID